MNANELADVLENDDRLWFVDEDLMVKICAMLRQQQAEIEELKTCLIVEQEHNELMVEDRSKYEALAHAGGVEVGKELKTLTISDRDILKIVHDKFTKFGFEADYIVEDTELIDFAKAILRKAQDNG